MHQYWIIVIASIALLGCVNDTIPIRDSVSSTYSYFQFGGTVSQSWKVVRNTKYAEGWSELNFNSLRKNCCRKKAEKTLENSLLSFSGTIYDSKKKTNVELSYFIYSEPIVPNQPFNFFALVFINDSECIKISCDLGSNYSAKRYQEILLNDGALQHLRHISKIKSGNVQGRG